MCRAEMSTLCAQNLGCSEIAPLITSCAAAVKSQGRKVLLWLILGWHSIHPGGEVLLAGAEELVMLPPVREQRARAAAQLPLSFSCL